MRHSLTECTRNVILMQTEHFVPTSFFILMQEDQLW